MKSPSKNHVLVGLIILTFLFVLGWAYVELAFSQEIQRTTRSEAGMAADPADAQKQIAALQLQVADLQAQLAQTMNIILQQNYAQLKDGIEKGAKQSEGYLKAKAAYDAEIKKLTPPKPEPEKKP